jgi:hypothetical protein
MKFESPVAAALNHLLESETWARERLAPFAGEALELRAPPLPALRFLIAADGRPPPAACTKKRNRPWSSRSARVRSRQR